MADRVGYVPLSPNLGVQVDLEASRPFTPAEQRDLGALFDEHHLLLFRGHELTLEDQRRTVGYLEEPHDNGVLDSAVTSKMTGNGELLFHSDLSYESVPTFGIALYAEQVAHDSPATTFANLHRAYLALPDGLRQRLDGRQALHIHEPGHTNERVHEEDATDQSAGALHPVFLRNPRTGEPGLYVSMLDTASIIGLDRTESEALLELAFGYLYAPDNLYSHHWQPHDLLVWNNLTLHHAREPQMNDAPRVLRRVKFGDAAACNVPYHQRTQRAMAYSETYS